RLHGLYHGDERWAPVVDCEKDFLVVVVGIAGAFNQQETELPSVGTDVEVRAGHGVGVIPAQAHWVRREVIAKRLAWTDHRRTFLHGAIVEDVRGKSVPVNDVGTAGGVRDVDGRGHALTQAQQRAGDLAVVGKGLDGNAGRDFDGAGLDRKSVVGSGRGNPGRP